MEVAVSRWRDDEGPNRAKTQLVPIQPIAARGEPNAVYSRMRQGVPWLLSLMEPIVMMCACSVPPWMASSLCALNQQKNTLSISVWMPATMGLRRAKRSRAVTICLIFAVVDKKSRRKYVFLVIVLAAGWWNALIPGSIAPVGSWCAGRRKWRITSLFFTSPVLN